MKYNDNGEWKDIHIKASDTLPIGTICQYSGEVAPAGWLICDGSAISRSTYSKLFEVIGTKYGTGNNTSTFNIPDLRGKFLLGSSSTYALGSTGGEATHTLTVNEMPSHTHSVTQQLYKYEYNAGVSGQVYKGQGPLQDIGFVTNPTGGGQAHNNMPPYVTGNYIIKYESSVSVTGLVTNVKSTSDKDTYSCEYLNNKTTWKLVGSKTNSSETNYISVPSEWNELYIAYIDSNNTLVQSSILTKEVFDIAYATKQGGTIGGWYNTSTDYGFSYIYISNSKIYASDYKVSGVDKKSTATLYVYYK